MEILLPILGGLACLVFMCTAAMLARRLLKRSRLIRRGIARLRSQTPSRTLLTPLNGTASRA